MLCKMLLKMLLKMLRKMFYKKPSARGYTNEVSFDRILRSILQSIFLKTFLSEINVGNESNL